MESFNKLRTTMTHFSTRLSKSELSNTLSQAEYIVEKLAYYFILKAFFVDMDWNPKVETQFTTWSFINKFKLDCNHKILINTFLHRLEDAKFGLILKGIQQPNFKYSKWVVINSPPSKLEIRQQIKKLQTELLKFPESAAEKRLLTHVGNQLYFILRGRVNALEVLFPSTDSSNFQYGVPAYYENSIPMKYIKASCIETAMFKVLTTWNYDNQDSIIKILEIGGGTGCTTIPVLKKLTDLNSNVDAALDTSKILYTFTDISNFFVSKAKENLTNNFPTINFKFDLLDIEKDPIEQGYNEGDYDIILVADVFHATRYLDDTIKHTRKLLKSNGLLILGEMFQSSRFLECTFGLTDGWWRFADYDLRKNGPLLNTNEWEIILKQFGFSKTFVAGNHLCGVVFGSAENI